MCIPFLCITLGCLQCSRLELCLQPSELHYCCQVSSQKTTTFKFAEHLKANLFSCLDLLTFILCYINEIIIITITDLQCTETIEHLDQVSSGNLFITTCSELRKVLFWASLVCSFFFVCVRNISGTAEQICTKFTQKMCLVPRLDEFEGQRSRSPGTKNGIFRSFDGMRAVYVW